MLRIKLVKKWLSPDPTPPPLSATLDANKSCNIAEAD